MMTPTSDSSIATSRRGFYRVYHQEDLPVERVLDALNGPGEVLKVSGKSVTRRVGSWVLKESRVQAGLGIVKHTVLRARYRQAWIAGNHLFEHGVSVPRPHAFVEKGGFGIILGNVLITDYLEGCCNVEQFALRLDRDSEIEAFLSGIAGAVNALTATGAYHADLSGKNIFTGDGSKFYFIDLDGVVLNRSYTDASRMKNHVQLYDSFCDRWPPGVLDPFIARMLPAGYDVSGWLRAVHEGQAKRRATHQRVPRS
jgi:hypothetical protein